MITVHLLLILINQIINSFAIIIALINIIMLKNLIKIIEGDLVDKRNRYVYKYPNIIETIIHNTPKVTAIICMRDLLELDLNQLNELHNLVHSNTLTFTNAYNKVIIED